MSFIFKLQFTVLFLTNISIFIYFAAKFMEKDKKHCTLVTIYSTVQETSVSMDTVGWTSRLVSLLMVVIVNKNTEELYYDMCIT